MSSNLKVNTILPSTGTTIGIGTVGGLINIVGNIDVNSTSGISTFNGLEISGIVTAKAGAAVTYYGDGSNLTGISGGVTSDGSQNTVGGSNAGDSIVSGGTENTVFGYNAGTAISTGDNNTFFGSRSGRSFSTTVNNTGVGYNVMGNASGTGNAAVGRDAGNGMGDGINHCAIGFAAFANTNQIGTQQNNIVIGYLADVSGSTVSNEITLGNANITKFRIPGLNFYNDAGRLLIGTTTEGATGADELTIATTGSTGLTIRSGTSNDGNIFFSDATSGTGEYAGYVQYEHSNDALRFGTASTERLRITSGGNVGVNEATPDFSGFGGNGGGIELDDVNSGFTALKVSHGAADMYLASAGSAAFISTRTNHDIIVEKNSTEVARFTANGLKLPSGKGIDFSATGNVSGTQSELLDDYEEGTFTASMQGGSNSGSFSGSQQSRYVKIGKQITCWIMIHGDLSGASGNLEWTGFPFTSENPQEAVGSLQFNNMRGGMPSGTNTVFALMHPGLTKVHFRCNADGNNTAYTALSSSTNYGFTYARLVITYTTV